MKTLAVTSFAIASALAGCASVDKTYMADGREGYSISCDGAAVGINVCFEKAGEICQERGYDLIGRDGAIIPAGYATANNQSAFVSVGSFYTKSIRIVCKS